MAVGGGGDGESRSLEQTPTWAVAAVCLVFVVISILIERTIHLVGQWLNRRHKKALNEAMEKIKAELMLLGFISLLLTVGQKPISMICIPKSLGDTMLPCKKAMASSYVEHTAPDNKDLSSWLPHRKSFRREGDMPSMKNLALKHILATNNARDECADKMRCWKQWEEETKTVEFELSNHPSRFRFTRQTSFGRRHMRFWTRSPILIWIVCFFRQFVRSVPKVDYLTLRHGFILAHFAPHSKFNFHKYIKRSLENDFKVVVGISPHLWAFAVIFLLLDAHGWSTYFWLSFVPFIIILVIGTKLQVIITKMGLEIQDRHAVVKGTPVVHPNDEWFWFGRPQWVLYLIHFTLFQNAFQLAFFFWTWYEYGLDSCFHERLEEIITRIVMGIGVQFLCIYITLPLYALVTQMGSNMKQTIFEEQTAKALKRWHKNARKNLKRKSETGVSSRFTSGQTTPTAESSPSLLLRRYNSTGDINEGAAQIFQRFNSLEYDTSDLEMGTTYSSFHLSPKYSTSVWNAEDNQKKNEPSGQNPKPEDTRIASPRETAGQHPTIQDIDSNNSADFSFSKP